jgi:hypothetical protein
MDLAAIHPGRIEASLPTVCGESGGSEENSRQRVWALDLWLACEFDCLVQFLHLE